MISNSLHSGVKFWMIFAISLACFHTASGQFYIEAYGGAGKYNKLSNINRALYKYNITRDWLTHDMTGMNRKIFTGWEVAMGNPEKYMEMTVSSFKQSTYAKGPQPDLKDMIGSKEVKIWNSNFYLMIIYPIWESDQGRSEVILGLGPGMEAVKSKVIYTGNVLTGENVEEMISQNYTWGLRLSTAYKLFVFDWLGVVVKPSYYLTGKVSVNDIHNNILNINTVFPADLVDNFSNFSLSVGLNISFGRY